MKILPIRFLILILCLGASASRLHAQLDTIHWIPPMFGSITDGDHFIDLTTPETTPFPVHIRNASGAILKTVMLSKGKAFRYVFTPGVSQLLIPANVIGVVQQHSGIVIHGPKAFHAAFRYFSKSETFATYLPLKGRSALGTVFRIGHTRQVTDKTGLRNNIIGILATENNTEVEITGMDPMLAEFPGGVKKVTLQAGESIVYTHYVGDIGDDQPRNGFMGALLTASKPVAVISGSWMGAPVVYILGNDLCIDQLLPLEETGKEFILCMGNGPSELEHPIVIAHTDDTRIWFNDSKLPDTTLQAGQYYVLPASYYLPRGNMSIRSSAPIFVFQMIGGFKTGSSQLQTGSLMVVPPIQCGLPTSLDYVLLPNRLRTTRFSGGLMVVAKRNAQVKAWVSGVLRPLGNPVDVPGNPDFVTYRAMSMFTSGLTDSTLRVESDGAIQVSMVLRNKEGSYAALFSGPVIRRPSVELSLDGDGICPDTVLAQGDFDGLSWIYDDSLFLNGPDRDFQVLAPGKYKVVAYLDGCRQTATVLDSIQAPLAAPEFDFTSEQPSCFGFSDGRIDIGEPNGGTPPYRYSIDFGQHLSDDPVFDQVHAGNYKLVVEDASGCYNQPVHFTMGQPDSVFVDLYFKKLPEPLRPHEEVILKGNTGGLSISGSTWTPPSNDLCADCLEYAFRPEKSVWVKLTVYDSGGCPGSDSILVLVTPAVYAPNAIIPGSDQPNGIFTLYSEHPIPVTDLFIYDRWGALIFENHGFMTNDPTVGWSGLSRDMRVSPGVFVFTALVEVEPGRFEKIRGDITVIH